MENTDKTRYTQKNGNIFSLEFEQKKNMGQKRFWWGM